MRRKKAKKRTGAYGFSKYDNEGRVTYSESKGVDGEFYPCKPDIFEKTYDIVEDE